MLLYDKPPLELAMTDAPHCPGPGSQAEPSGAHSLLVHTTVTGCHLEAAGSPLWPPCGSWSFSKTQGRALHPGSEACLGPPHSEWPSGGLLDPATSLSWLLVVLTAHPPYLLQQRSTCLPLMARVRLPPATGACHAQRLPHPCSSLALHSVLAVTGIRRVGFLDYPVSCTSLRLLLPSLSTVSSHPHSFFLMKSHSRVTTGNRASPLVNWRILAHRV